MGGEDGEECVGGEGGAVGVLEGGCGEDVCLRGNKVVGMEIDVL